MERTGASRPAGFDIRYVSNEPTNNGSIRARFAIAERNKVLAARLIKEATDETLISIYDPLAGPRAIRYVPYRAEPDRWLVDGNVQRCENGGLGLLSSLLSTALAHASSAGTARAGSNLGKRS